MPDALARMQALLPDVLGAEADGGGASLWRFLPDAECLASAGLAGEDVRDPELLRRSAAASTLAAGLLARQGRVALAQERSFGAIQVRAGEGAPVTESAVGR
jgi:hypothetical protein